MIYHLLQNNRTLFYRRLFALSPSLLFLTLVNEGISYMKRRYYCNEDKKRKKNASLMNHDLPHTADMH
jgi:hypothetical protein